MTRRRSQPYRLDYSGDQAALPGLVSQIDEMFQTLFDDLATIGDDTLDTSTIVQALIDLSTTGLLARIAAGELTTRQLVAGTGISISNGDGVAADPSIALDVSGVSAGSYGSATLAVVIAVDAYGRITSASTVAITDHGITQLTGDVTAGPGDGSQAATLAASGVAAGSYGSTIRIPILTIDAKGRVTSASHSLLQLANDVDMLGDLLAVAITAPGTPSAGTGRIYVDSTSKNLAVKDDAGVVKHGVRTKASASHQYLTAIADDGTVSAAQPDYSDLSSGATAGGDLTGSYPNPTVDANKITYAKMQQASAASVLLGRRSTGAGNLEEIALGSGLSMSGTTLSATSTVSLAQVAAMVGFGAL